MSSPEEQPPGTVPTGFIHSIVPTLVNPAEGPPLEGPAPTRGRPGPLLTPAATPSASALSGGGSYAPSGTQVAAGRTVRDEIAERVRVCESYERHKADFGDKNEPPKYPVTGYRLDKPIGEGAFGSVWRAYADGNEADVVAIKFFSRRHGNLDELGKELRNLAGLGTEQGFIQLREQALGAEWPYLVLTYAPVSLQQKLDAGPLPEGQAVRLFRQLVEAMAYAHTARRGLCHCDLKPSNVLLSDRDAPLISDFGKARLLDRADRATLGSFFYMPPDQADTGRERPDVRWDVYALGAIAYQMLSPDRKPPRSGGWTEMWATLSSKGLDVRLSTYRDHLRKAPRPTAHHRRADRRLAAVIDRCLELDPEKRFRDAGAVLDALKNRERARRRAPVLIVGALATVVCVVVALMLGRHYRRELVHREEQNVVSQVAAGQKDTAFVAARLMEDKLRRRVIFLERAAQDGGGAAPKGARAEHLALARDALVKAPNVADSRHEMPLADRWLHDDREPVDGWLKALGDRAEREGVFGSRPLFVVVNYHGYGYLFSLADPPGKAGSPPAWAVRSPWKNAKTLETFGKNFGWRDWFSGQGYKYLDDPKQAMPALDRSHLSVIHRTTSDGNWVIMASCPIIADGPGRPVAGLLVGGIDLQDDLTKWMREAPEQSRTSIVVVNDRGYVVWRRELAEYAEKEQKEKEQRPTGAAEQPADAARRAEEDRALYRRLESYARWQEQFPTEGDEAATNESFLDPWNDDEPGDRKSRQYIARREPFYPLPDRRPGDKPWYVLVLEDKGEALKPVGDLENKMMGWAGGVVGIFAGVAALVWGGVFWALRRVQGAGDA
jgi:hypothetical protein